MLITGTSDKIRFVLGATAGKQMDFTADYTTYSSSSLTLNTNGGVSSDTTPVDIVGSPGASQQNELRYCAIYNGDSASATVKIQIYDGSTAYQVFQAILDPGETLQYQLERGWETVDALGNKKNYKWQVFSNTIKGLQSWRSPNSISSSALTNNTGYLFNLGKAEKSYTSISVSYKVTANTIAGLSFAELGIYAGQRINSDGALPYRRVAYTDISGSISVGVKKVSITVSGIMPGETLLAYLMISATSGTISLNNLGGFTAMDVSDSTSGTALSAAPIWRPSLNSYMYYGAYNTTVWWINWQGT